MEILSSLNQRRHPFVVLILVFLLEALAKTERGHVSKESLIFTQYLYSLGPFSQVQKFFEIPFNESDYFGKLNSCPNEDSFLNSCQIKVNRWYRGKNLFVPQWPRRQMIGDYNRAKLDCLYEVSNKSMLSAAGGTSFLFSLRQRSCIINIFPYGGGSSFEVSAVIDDNYLVACSVIDHFDGQYTLSCIAPTTAFPLKSGVSVTLTVLLLFEHYDAYTENHYPCCNAPPNLYPPTRFVISDNQTFYFSETTDWDRSVRYHGTNEIQASKLLGAAFGLSIRNKVIVYTGLWRRGSANLSIFSLPWVNLLSTRRYRDFIAPSNYTLLYDYKASRLPKTTTGLAGFDFERFDIIAARKGPMVSPFDNCTHFYSLFRNLTADTTHVYYFYGASHMRYYYDALLELYIGRESLKNLSRKHEDGQVENFFLHSNTFTNQLVSQLDDRCSQLTRTNRTSNPRQLNKDVSLVMQSGAWDLTNHGIRSLLHQANKAPLLMKKIRDILSGVDPCPGLSHIVWVMTPTHPVCFNDFEGHCAPDRGYRTNPAIAALNAYYMNNLLNMTIADGIKLSIVDVFSVTRPRVLLNEDYEMIFKNHYVVRGETNDGMRVIYTPAGLATVQLLVAALTA